MTKEEWIVNLGNNAFVGKEGSGLVFSRAHARRFSAADAKKWIARNRMREYTLERCDA